ncbi:hypothetical protein GCM10008955_29550 [Deinococcus malanensis]|uniref:SPOR domain-containing protein n=1 Tax=Deinococcus malanensis TaxID=1706855 RepID=A0ABQ2EZ26_9DEIO|nr:hypothetical protein [Deinococcus malanensis]GGK33589.1 hypothetical protein GCM10008955_29550 [Deinococcus malanensis]
MVVVLEAPQTMSDPVFLLTGPWNTSEDRQAAQREIEDRLLPQSFFNLKWLDLP